MKKVLPLLVLGAAFASASVQAEGNWYIGADVLKSDIKDATELQFSSATGFSVAVGKELQYSENFKLALEGEYINHGRFEGKYGQSLKYSIEGYGFNLNAKPKYHFSGTGFYVGAVAGLGLMVAEWEVKSSAEEVSVKTDNSDTVFNYGAEVGYEFASGLIISGGYRVSSVTIEYKGLEYGADLEGLYAGVDYKF
ncbi:outer membrane beta-barrel protein [Vibrio sp. AND4]|uniref:outer membrane beta-barrel protein n=1 Tax=Vibrio sp. AND4 TaxID=314289 RepID=UPI00015F03ED|nr:outer membrane beta-barrel protein [Vibrio sp. AND4]EDP58695.1 hypothetical protein AND4_14691 [Vibrio sp. AND4]